MPERKISYSGNREEPPFDAWWTGKMTESENVEGREGGRPVGMQG